MNDREVAGLSDREVVGSVKVVGAVDKFNNLSVVHSQTVGFGVVASTIPNSQVT